MKKVVIPAIFATLAFSGICSADSGPGCGVGTQIFKGQSGLFAHTLAATTNGSTWNQWFGLTSGTLECDPNAVVSNEYEREVFVAMNLDNISQELAQGEGDHLRSLAALFEVAPEHQAHFIDLSKQQLPAVLAEENSNARTLLTALTDAMSNDPMLARYTH